MYNLLFFFPSSYLIFYLLVTKRFQLIKNKFPDSYIKNRWEIISRCQNPIMVGGSFRRAR